MTGRTGSPEARVALPAVCPGCGRQNEIRGWIEYRSDPNVVGCGGCGHVVYYDPASSPPRFTPELDEGEE